MRCTHPFSKIELTPQGPHHGKLICSICGAFLGWSPKPETVERNRVMSEFLKAVQSVRLTDWEKEFIRTAEGMKPSPKQWACISKIAWKYGLQDPTSHA